MTRTGRPRTPTELKVVRGTDRADRRNPAEPQPARLEVGSKPPEWLADRRARRAWRHLAKMLGEQRILTVMDAMALAMLCDAFADYLEAGDELARLRRIQEAEAALDGDDVRIASWFPLARIPDTAALGKTGVTIREHPAVKRRERAWMRVSRMLSEFGMTPSARARVAAAAEESKDPTEAFLEGSG